MTENFLPAVSARDLRNCISAVTSTLVFWVTGGISVWDWSIRSATTLRIPLSLTMVSPSISSRPPFLGAGAAGAAAGAAGAAAGRSRCCLLCLSSGKDVLGHDTAGGAGAGEVGVVNAHTGGQLAGIGGDADAHAGGSGSRCSRRRGGCSRCLCRCCSGSGMRQYRPPVRLPGRYSPADP